MEDSQHLPSQNGQSANGQSNGQADGFDADEKITDIVPLSGLYENWFLDYASYVILERAVPGIGDGMKPVQRRILHAMKEMDDGRFNKVANVIGQTMQYHPHGDASIGDAIVNLGQKDLLIETQGNWGDVRTGDSAAAPRYIEARLSKFAHDVLFSPKITEWQASYDGRKREPVSLPAKFPLLLAQGVEGIAVGLSTKIMPHNFCELCEASIQVLKGKPTDVLPDFPTGGTVDVSQYNGGQKGGRIRVRARIESYDRKTLVIRDIPYGTTTTNLIDSIIKANDKGKIKVKRVVDNTAQDVEILVSLAPGVSPDVTIDALYAFTDCEVSISPNACVIVNNKPQFLSVNDILRINADNTMELLRRELEIRRSELKEKILFASLEKIFIENRIYRKIEECETWPDVIATIDKGLKPYKKQFYREITQDDIVRLTEIRIKRISKYDSFKADELMRDLQTELDEVENNLANLRDFTILFFKQLLKKYGAGRERKTEIRQFDTIQAAVVAVNNQKLYVNRKEGFVGYGLKKDEFVCDCSDLDDIIVMRKDGTMQVSKVAEKTFVGKDILYVGVFKRNDERMVYNMAYLDGGTGRTMVKRFQVLGVTRDREYNLISDAKGSRVTYLSANPNGEAEIVTAYLTQGSTARKKSFEFDFATIDIKNRNSRGNLLTKYPVRRLQLKQAGSSTLGGLEIWYDPTVGRLNTEERGYYVGEFEGEDRILVVHKDGSYELTTYELTNRYEPDSVGVLEKFEPEGVVTAVYYEGKQKAYYVKRFNIETSSINKRFLFLPDSRGTKLILATTDQQAQLEVTYKKDKKSPVETTQYDFDMLVDVKGWKALGNRLTNFDVSKVKLLASDPEQDIEKVVENGRIKSKSQLGIF
ncbi:DNA gyrase/topoisomerase IV subunit A [Catalinimonas alkaloidigena]|uniref:DNA gyrase/topoisomerase IV subunit A n=1 Tax=Catalinimonas alkaloidigena TaxID=1075417 RepID=UPI0021CD72DC|nr:DNA gyrase/topoisomerase IV subunit A [Catalinimonas alkaloidigena]